MALGTRPQIAAFRFGVCHPRRSRTSESRGAHTRDDYPESDENYGRLRVVVRGSVGDLSVTTEPLPDFPADVRQLLEEE